MKTNIVNVLALIFDILMTVGVSSCSQDNDLLVDSMSGTKIINAHFTVDKIDFDSQGSTRSGGSGSGWSHNETIYLKFDNTMTGTAVYNYYSDNWNIKLNGNLQSTTKGRLEAYYFDYMPSASSDKVTLTATNGIYHDADGVYSYTAEGNLNIGIILKPLTSRIRFKGAAGENITINEGITTYSSFSTSTFSLTTTTEPIDLSPFYSGYTNYVYGIFTNNLSPVLKVTNGCYIFKIDCPATMFKVGESGWMNIPNQAEHNGWTIVTDANGLCPDTNHPHKVDMGFGVKFACCNLGASSPSEFGGYYAWGETETKELYKWSTYKWCDGSDNTGTADKTYLTKYCTNSSYGMVDNKTQLEASDDAAHVNWGNTWRMPSGDELSQLFNTCTWERVTFNKIEGYKVTAKNGNSIFLPVAGFTTDEHYGFSTTYLSSTLYPGEFYNYFAMQITFYIGLLNTPTMEYNYGIRYIGNSIRPVSN